MPKRMMFAKLQTARPAGGTKQRWKDCVQHDLRFMGLEEGWSEVAQQRDKWHSATKEAGTKWEKEKNAQEQAAYEQKKAGIGVKCPHCEFVAKNEKGLKSHVGQKHPKWNYYPEDSSSSDSEEEEEEAPGKGKKKTASTSAPTSLSSSSSSSSSKYVCLQCGKDCTSGSGLSSHLRWNAVCKAAADLSKKGR